MDRNATEFFAPFAHIPGRYEWCRIRSPTHGVFDCFIVLGESTQVACTVYVASDRGAAFMRDRYPESTCIQVPAQDLRLDESADGFEVRGELRATEGPVREVKMVFQAAPGVPRQVAYGADHVWGSQFACQGVDLELDARVAGHVVQGSREDIDGPAIVTVGSYGTLTHQNGSAP